MSLQSFLDHLELHGYAVIPNFLDLATTARIRAHTDSLIPQPPPANQYIHTIRHPMPGTIMAELLNNPALLDLVRTTLRVKDNADLRMLEQVLIRSDPSPPGPTGWHVDMAFLPEHYNSTPRATYYHMVHCCNTVKPGGAAFTIVPGSHKLTYAATAKLTIDQLREFKTNPVAAAGIDLSKAIEVCANDGDLLVFNPMCLHSGSGNSTPNPRYVYFASFMDKSAAYLTNDLKSINYNKGVHDDLRNNVPASLSPIFDW